MNYLYSIMLTLLALLGGTGGAFIAANYVDKDTVIETSTGAVVVGKVSSEIITYRMKVVEAKDVADNQATGWMKTGAVPPNEFMIPFIEQSLGSDFSYDATLQSPVAFIIETSVIYVGDKGMAEKVIDSRALVFHNGTTIKQIIADTALHTKTVNEFYKTEHSFLQ